MSEPELVRGCERGTPGDRDLAGRLQHRAAAQLVGVPHAGRICGGQWLWKRRWLRHLGKRFAFPTFPQPRRRRPYFDLCSETENPGSFVMTGPKTGGRSPRLAFLPLDLMESYSSIACFVPSLSRSVVRVPLNSSYRRTVFMTIRSGGRFRWPRRQESGASQPQHILAFTFSTRSLTQSIRPKLA